MRERERARARERERDRQRERERGRARERKCVRERGSEKGGDLFAFELNNFLCRSNEI